MEGNGFQSILPRNLEVLECTHKNYCFQQPKIKVLFQILMFQLKFGVKIIALCETLKNAVLH